jgi:hypothetical protein
MRATPHFGSRAYLRWLFPASIYSSLRVPGLQPADCQERTSRFGLSQRAPAQSSHSRVSAPRSVNQRECGEPSATTRPRIRPQTRRRRSQTTARCSSLGCTATRLLRAHRMTVSTMPGLPSASRCDLSMAQRPQRLHWWADSVRGRRLSQDSSKMRWVQIPFCITRPPVARG